MSSSDSHTNSKSMPTAWIFVALLAATTIQAVVFFLVTKLSPGSVALVLGLWLVPGMWLVVLILLLVLAIRETRRLSGRLSSRTGLAVSAVLFVVVAAVGLISGYIAQDGLTDLFIPCHDLFGGDPPVCDPWLPMRSMFPMVGLAAGALIGWLIGVRALVFARSMTEID